MFCLGAGLPAWLLPPASSRRGATSGERSFLQSVRRVFRTAFSPAFTPPAPARRAPDRISPPQTEGRKPLVPDQLRRGVIPEGEQAGASAARLGGGGGGIHGFKGASGGVPARGPGISPDICPRAPPSPRLFSLRNSLPCSLPPSPPPRPPPPPPLPARRSSTSSSRSPPTTRATSSSAWAASTRPRPDFPAPNGGSPQAAGPRSASPCHFLLHLLASSTTTAPSQQRHGHERNWKLQPEGGGADG